MTTVLPVDPAVEVLVVGAGATGAAAAWRLAGAGREVLCLEQGGWVDPATYPALRPDYELHRLGAWSGNPNVRRLDWDYPVNEDDSPISPLMYNAVGGSTIVWAAHWPRMRPSDFRVRTLDGVADDWPLSYWDLESYLDLNDHIMGVAGLAGDPANPPRSPRPTPPLPIGVQGHTLVRGFEKLGWHWWPADAAILSADYDGRQSCNYCGPCDLGCSRQAKASVDYTYWPKALALGVKLRSNARVRTVTVDDSGNASGVEYYDAEGHLRFQPAGRVVLAANGIGTARLLLKFHLAPLSHRPRQQQRLGGPKPDVPSLWFYPGCVRRAGTRHTGTTELQPDQSGVLRDGPVARLRARVHLPGTARHLAGGAGDRRLDGRAGAMGLAAPPVVQRTL